VYGIDVRVPGMVYAGDEAIADLWRLAEELIVRRDPEHAGRDRRGADGEYRTRKRRAVVADSWWRAKTALDKLPIEWERGSERQSEHGRS
jgi:isoquinoline 1-oxidoreductase beta subunit